MKDRPLWHYGVGVAVVLVFAYLGRPKPGEEPRHRSATDMGPKYRHNMVGDSENDRQQRAAAKEALKQQQARSTVESGTQRFAKLAADLAKVTADREVPCPMKLGTVEVGQQLWLAWIAADFTTTRPQAPGSQSRSFDYAARNFAVVGSSMGARGASLTALAQSEHLAIAVPTRFEQVQRTAEAPGFTGGIFEGYLVIVSTADRKVVCSAKLDVRVKKLGPLSGGAQLDDLSNWHAWEDPFVEAVNAALRRIAGPDATMAP